MNIEGMGLMLSILHGKWKNLLLAFVLGWMLQSIAFANPAERRVISLDGTWNIAQGDMDHIPDSFKHHIPVPGLADMAVPAFQDVGYKSPLRQAFWYERTFTIPGAIPANAILKIHKAEFGTRIYLNGKLVGDHLPCFTPALFQVKSYLRGNNLPNTLIIRVGAYRDSVPSTIPNGSDFEKIKYIPGIYDSVDLILSGTPSIVNVQTAPEIKRHSVRVQVDINNFGPAISAPIHFTVRERLSGKIVGSLKTAPIAFPRDGERVADVRIPIKPVHLWSPESPFLYTLETDTGHDRTITEFGMRNFYFKNGKAYLNDRPYYMRGSNICIFRFFEDPERGDLPWNKAWVRKLFASFKKFHWNAFRFCIGYPPDFWYRIADEEGYLIQDEFPIWYGGQWPPELKSDELAKEYAEHMREAWNHPCVVLWDAQNESISTQTGPAIHKVRSLDLSHRPWDNGYGAPDSHGDSYESHPYLFQNPNFKLSGLASFPWVPQGNARPNTGRNAIIINEYDWLWLNRDGSPTTLSRQVYLNLLGPNSTTAQRRLLYARYMAAITEFWRCHRACAGVLEFCGLDYSRPNGQTSDNFINVAKLEFEPEFLKYMSDACNPIGVMLNFWDGRVPQGRKQEISAILINDLYKGYHGQVALRLLQNGNILSEQTKPLFLPALGQKTISFPFEFPQASGSYQLQAVWIQPGKPPITSHRYFNILSEAEIRESYGLAYRKPVTASSSVTVDGVTYPASNAVDGSDGTRWSSDFSDPQWLAVDLGKPEEISRVELDWENAYGLEYHIDVSLDGKNWRTVYSTDSGKGGTEIIRFPKTMARWVRFYGVKRGTPFGYSLWEFRVFP